MKRTAAIFVLAVFLFNISGYYMVFEIARFRIRINAEAMIKSGASGEFHRLVIPKDSFSALVWTNKHEFIYQGRMYDLVSMRPIGGNIQISCINDKKEEDLNAGLARMADHEKKVILSAASHIITIALPESDFTLENASPVVVQSFIISDDILRSCNILIDAPPPRLTV